MTKRSGIVVLLLLSGASACADGDQLSRRIEGRWGPDPVIDAARTRGIIARQINVLNYIASESGIASESDPIGSFDARWFHVAEWGFNIGREDCASYLQNIFQMQREKARGHNLLAALHTAASGVVTATAPREAKALSILASTFGLATAINDEVLGSYLFTEAPGLIANKVKKLQDKYQTSLNPDSITTSAEAYSALQNYYDICMPQTIEGVILQKVAVSGATSGDEKTAERKTGTSPVASASDEKTSMVIQKSPSLQ